MNLRASSDGPPIGYDAVGACLERLGGHVLRLDASVPLPGIGCGLVGGRWEQMGALVHGLPYGRGLRARVYELDTGAGPQR